MKQIEKHPAPEKLLQQIKLRRQSMPWRWAGRTRSGMRLPWSRREADCQSLGSAPGEACRPAWS